MSEMIISMTELLSRIDQAKKKLDTRYSSILDIDHGAKPSRALISLYNPSRGVSVNGVEINAVENSIKSSYDGLVNTLENLQKYIVIKDEVNKSCQIMIPSLEDPTQFISVTVSKALSLKNADVKRYYLGLLRKMNQDCDDVLEALKTHEETVMSSDRVSRYVVAKMNALGMGSDEETIKKSYSTFSKEYIENNELKMLDPISLFKKRDNLEAWISEFYTTIDLRLHEFNASTKIKIDLDKDINNLWSLV